MAGKDRIKIAIAGVGNCASSLLQGIEYYRNKENADTIGLMHLDLGGYLPSDIEVAAAFDIDKRKIGKDVSEAIFSLPNCTTAFCPDVPKTGIEVKMGRVLDGCSEHLINYPEDCRFSPVEGEGSTKEEIINTLQNSGVEILVNYMPVGSEEAARFYAECALKQAVPLSTVCLFLLRATLNGRNALKKRNSLL